MKSYLLIPLVVGMVSCGRGEKEPELPNILWITHEDLSPIYGCYGDQYSHTPNIDSLAASGYRFTQAFSNAPICAPARSTLITGMYATSLGTQHLRSEVPVPDNLETLPEIMSEAGYYTTNNVKTDYNFSPDNRWDELSSEAHWRNRPEDKPFFSVFNFMITHEGPINALRDSDTEMVACHHNPEEAILPPYIPDTPKMREIWAHMYDLLTVFDQGVGDLLDQLEEDGLRENTIVFVFSDHGHGLPGHKRWLNNAGLQVPFVLYVPEKYKHLVDNLTGPVADQLVGFVDFAPTVISLARAEVPGMMEGRNFLGSGSDPKKYIFGYRDRADDCYEMSRSVYDGRYLYVRHFMPQLPYYQDAVIFKRGGSYVEINSLKDMDRLPEPTMQWFTRKPAEELYDLQNDRWEQNNLIGDSRYAELVEQLSGRLNKMMIEHYDTGLIEEGELMTMAENSQSSVYETVRKLTPGDFSQFAEAAQLVGKVNNPTELIPALNSESSIVRFWALVAIDAFEGDITPVDERLKEMLKDEAWSVAGKAAEIRIKRFDDSEAYDVLEEKLRLDYEPVVLQAAISVRQLGEKAQPLLSAIQNDIMPQYSGNIWERYRNWSYPMFIGMALDQTQINCGVDIELRK